MLSVSPDSPRWELQGQARPAEYQGRKCLYLDGGAATLKDFEMRDGVVDVNISTPASRGFFGIQFRIAGDGANAQWVYLRQHKSGLPDAMQYTSVLSTGPNWQIYNGPGFTGALDIPKDAWFHLRLEVTGAQAKLYVKDMDKPALVMSDLKSGVQKGHVALAVLTGATYFRLFQTPGPAARHGRLRADHNRVRTRPGEEALHRLRRRRQRLPQRQDSLPRPQRPELPRPGFLGIISPENDAVYLPLKKGRNQLLLALSELGGGWGFVCRLADFEN